MRINKASYTQTVLFICLILVIGAFSLSKNATLLVLVPVLWIKLFDREVSLKELRWLFLFLSVYCFLVFVSSIRFTLFPQALVLYEQDKDLLNWMKSGHLHAIRLLIAYPGLLLSEFAEISIDRGMTVYCGALMCLIYNHLLTILKLYGAEDALNYIICGILIVALSFFMHGRIIFAFYGLSLMLSCETKFLQNRISITRLQMATVLGNVVSFVSSGTAFVIMAYTIIIAVYRWKKLNRTVNRVIYVFTILVFLYPVITSYMPLMIAMVQKNLNYFGGGFLGIVNMLQHGFGKVFNTSSQLLMVILIVMGVLVFSANVYWFKKKIVCPDNEYLPIMLMANISLYGGLFGLSTASMIIIPVAVLFCASMHSKASVSWKHRMTISGSKL